MARGSWDDFTDKYGFGDGATSELRDWNARDGVVRGLNMLLKDYMAVPFDRFGMHNSCLIVMAPRQEKEPTEILETLDWSKVKEYERLAFEELGKLPPDKDGLAFDIENLIREVYDELDDDVPPAEVCGELVVQAHRTIGLTDKQYVDAGGMTCPACGGVDTVEIAGEMEHVACSVIQPNRCTACRAQWIEVYRLAGFESLERNPE